MIHIGISTPEHSRCHTSIWISQSFYQVLGLTYFQAPFREWNREGFLGETSEDLRKSMEEFGSGPQDRSLAGIQLERQREISETARFQGDADFQNLPPPKAKTEEGGERVRLPGKLIDSRNLSQGHGDPSALQTCERPF